MTSIIRKTVKSHIYYYLVESARVNGKPRIVRQRYPYFPGKFVPTLTADSFFEIHF
jgi:hypothetical protein